MVMETDGHKALFGCCAHERAIHWLSCHIHRCSNKTKQGNYCRWRTVGSRGGRAICPPLKYTDGRLRDKANVAPCYKAEGGGEREKKESSANGNNAPTSTTNISVDVNKAVTFISPVLCYRLRQQIKHVLSNTCSAEGFRRMILDVGEGKTQMNKQ